ncbi:MAG TPA: glycosyltransferase family A protein [Candidatus Paceibacterota bacterium]|nr:glycosyltransferase family A protein [Candidatus Paceibacterota bacterium]
MKKSTAIKVSIVITCYNKERYVARAINSCINQDFPTDQYEIIVVDDGSTDNSRDTISLYEGFAGYHFIRTTFLRKNRGPAHASNVGIKMARGEYVVRVDADDYIHKDFLRTMVDTLRWNPDIGFVYCDLIMVTGSGAPDQRVFARNTKSRLLNHGAGVMFRKSLLQELRGYDPSLRNCEDYELLLRLLKKNSGYHLRLPYYRYFKEGSALSTKHAERRRLQKALRARHRA